LAKLLECPDLDYLSSPNVYNRVIGEDWPPMVAVQSVHLHGKLWLAENDTRTSITTLLKDRSSGIAPPGQYESGVWLGPDDMETSVALLWKNAGRMLSYGYGGWWFDMWGGWFSDPELLNVLAKTQQFHSDFHPNKEEKYQTEVCVFVDEELPFWDLSHGGLSRDIVSNCYSLGKTGASYNLFLRSDLDAISTEQYKVIWLMGVLELSEAEKHKIKKWQQPGITILWTNGSSTSVYDKNKTEKSFPKKIKWKDSELRKIWKNAGVHIYNDSNDVTYVGNNWLCIHTVKGGERTINFPCPTQVYDPLKKETLADSTKSLKLNLAPKSTMLLRIYPLEEKE
jgi:beta-galactosidase